MLYNNKYASYRETFESIMGCIICLNLVFIVLEAEGGKTGLRGTTAVFPLRIPGILVESLDQS